MIYCVDLDGTLSKGDMSLRAFVYLSIPEFDTYIVQNLYFQCFERFYTVVYTDFNIS